MNNGHHKVFIVKVMVGILRFLHIKSESRKSDVIFNALLSVSEDFVWLFVFWW